MNTAILIIDMQKDFFKKKKLLRQKNSLVENINEITNFARKKKIPVIWIRQIWKHDLHNSPKHIRNSGKGYVLQGSKGSELVEGLNRLEGDYEIIKTRYSGFFKTELEMLLNELKVNTLVVCGINTHACVRMTVIDAWQRDFDVIVAEECVGSYDSEHHKITMKYFDPVIAKIKSNKEIRQLNMLKF